MKGKRTSVIGLTLSLVTAVTAATLGTASAIASPQQTATFAVAGEFGSPGSFTSHGSVVCANGSTSDEFLATGFQSDRGIVLHDRKTISCDDGSGTFTLLVQGRTGFNEGDGTSGQWVVLEGTGDYVDLHGRGSFAGSYTPVGEEPTGVSEVYVGWLTLPPGPPVAP